MLRLIDTGLTFRTLPQFGRNEYGYWKTALAIVQRTTKMDREPSAVGLP